MESEAHYGEIALVLPSVLSARPSVRVSSAKLVNIFELSIVLVCLHNIRVVGRI